MRVRPENPYSTYLIPPAEGIAMARAFGLVPPGNIQPRDARAVMAAGAREGESARAVARRGAVRYAAMGVGLVVLLHAWVMSAGWVTPWPEYSTYCNRQAEAFLHRQVSLITRPNPAHLALPDPYEPVANRPFRQTPGVHDSVLFGGKLYLYWGPVPALLLVPLKAVFHLPVIGDEWLVFAFSVGIMLFTATLLLRIRERFFPDQPGWMLFLAIVVAGLATPLPFLLARAAVYEAAILGGQCFLLAGLSLLFGKLPARDAASSNAHGAASGDAASPHPLPGAGRLALIGTCFALAVGSRVSLAVAVMALGALIALRIVRLGWHADRRRMFIRLAAFALPLVSGAVALGAYNHVRFGSWSEFGQRYQLTGKNYRATPHLMSPAHVLPSLYSYTLRPLAVERAFPFLLARTGDGTFPSFLHLPPNYESNEQIAGLLLVTPFVWLTAIPCMLLCRRLFSLLRAGLKRKKAVAPPDTELHWLLLCLLTAALLGFAPVLFAIGSTMRYLADLTPCLMIVAAVGMWLRADAVRGMPRRRGVFLSIVGVMGVYSVVVGMLLGVTGYYGHFHSFNPQWFKSMSQMTGTPVND